MAISKKDLEELVSQKKYTKKKIGNSYEELVARLFSSMSYSVQRNIKKVGFSKTAHEIDVLATYDAPLHKNIIAIECKSHGNPIDKDVVMKLNNIVADIGADKGIVVSKSGFTSGALSYSKSSNIELWTHTKLEKELEKAKTNRDNLQMEEFEEDEDDKAPAILITNSGFIGEIKNKCKRFFGIVNNTELSIRNVQAKITIKNDKGEILDMKVIKLGTISPNSEQTYPVSFDAFTGSQTMEVIVFNDETEFNMKTFDFKIKSPGACFIATAAFGTPFAKEIDILRNWRDISLKKHLIGRKFIIFYYYISPPIAHFIENINLLKSLTRSILKPFIKILKQKYS